MRQAARTSMKRRQFKRERGSARAAVALIAALFALAALIFFFSRSPGADEKAERAPAAPSSSPASASERAVVPELESAPASVPRQVVDDPAAPEARALEPEPPPALFWCRVVADESGAPLSGARATFDNGADPEATSDALGLFSWPIEPNRIRRLHVRLAGRAPRFVMTRTAHANRAEALEVRMSLGCAIDARIIPGCAPIEAGLSLSAQVPGSALHDLTDERRFGDFGASFSAPFTLDGRALLAELPARAAIEVSVLDADYFAVTESQTIVLEPGETRVLEIELRTGVTLSVRVVDQHDTVVRDRLLWLVRQPQTPPEQRDACYFEFADLGSAFAHQTTNADGLAVFDDVPPGIWWLGPAKEDPNPERAGELVAALATRIELDQRREQEVTLQVHRGLYLRGRIVDSSGAAVARAFVGCEHESIAGHVTGDVGADGRFELGPVASGVHLVRAIPHGVFLPPEPVRSEAGGSEILITLARGGVLSGRVVDAAIGTGTRADLMCSRGGNSAPTLASIGDEGAFRFSGLEPGTYTVVARTPDGRAGYVADVAIATEGARDDLRIELSPAARLQLRRSGGPERASIAIRIADAIVFTEELPRGVQRELFVPAAALSVSLTIGAEPPRVRTVETRAGATAEVVFELD